MNSADCFDSSVIEEETISGNRQSALTNNENRFTQQSFSSISYSKINKQADANKMSGIKIESEFCDPNVADPFETVNWEIRSTAIKDDNGETIFEQTDCEIPTTWSPLATKVVVSKYFYGEPGTSEREYSVRQLIYRVCRTIADWGKKDGYFASDQDVENFYRDLTWLCLHQYVAFNSPVWFNVGLFHQYNVQGTMCNWRWSQEAQEAVQPENPYEFPQASACFIQSVDDNMEAIMDLASSEALLFKFGSGTGTDLSTLRSCREKLSGGGKPSGPLSFMRVYDQIAAVVKSGGKTRRAAKMQSLKVWHPDVMEFIDCKNREEQKARILVREGLHYEDAYSSILFQNANLSVRVTDDFMNSVQNNQPWTTHWVTNPKQSGPSYQAREVFDKIASSAWACGDPGLQYDTTINRWHTCPVSGRINASNPCSEYMFLDNSACNLASVNLMRFREEGGRFNFERFVAACRLVYMAQDILVDHASYPIKKITENSHRYRPLGLGYTNLGSLIMSMGLPYDSEEANGLCSAITALLTGAAYRTSSELARAVGTFDAYPENKDSMLGVIDMHNNAVAQIKNSPRYLKQAAQQLWKEVVEFGHSFGFRNAQATVLAPTGTISFMMDCDTTGIEPDIALVKFKQLAGGGMLKMVNGTVPLALETLGYHPTEIKAITDFIEENRTIEGAPGFLSEHLPVFDCAFPAPNGSQRCIPWQAHVRMMAAAQPFISGAISKTVNMPNNATPQDIADAYMLGWKLGLKALAVYRDGSKAVQPLSTSSEKDQKNNNSTNQTANETDKDAASLIQDNKEFEDQETKTASFVEPQNPKATFEKESRRHKRTEGYSPRRERLPDTRQSVTHKFNVAGHEGYITVGLYPDKRVGELFITMAKEGSTIGGLMDCFSTALSMSLQYGVPLKVYVEKFSHTRFEPMGFTKNPDIPIAKSLVDYIFRWLGSMFLQVEEHPVMPHSENGYPGSVAAVGYSSEALTPSLPDKAKGPRAIKKSRMSIAASDIDEAIHHVSQKKELSVPNNQIESEMDNICSHKHSLPHFAFEDGIGKPTYNAESDESETQSEQFASFQSDAPACDSCGSICVRSGNCYLCYNCGRSMGCS
ncbi:MAG: vitamin B12-dependent ribonucleotide reductase [Planctomycetia bacterium]|nr:vitamin B12-dependent ribonucleotide reductase [Planctomycetia bacterium]